MTDRELLELAAKAAGLTINTWQQAKRDRVKDPSTASLWLTDGTTAWNPIKNDSDALRLAVALNLTVRVGEVTSQDTCSFSAGLLKIKQDPYAATRRAIVIAAAAIGKEMQ